MGAWETIKEKLNPAQGYIAGGGGTIEASNGLNDKFTDAYERIEVVNRGVNLIVDDACQIPIQVGDHISRGVPRPNTQKKKQVDRLLNVEPNPFQDISTFKRNLIIDLIMDGNIFIYFDGAHLYHVPANRMHIEKDSKFYVKKYVYAGTVEYSPEEIIHVKENSFNSIFRGESRLKSAVESMELMLSMKDFQDNFFKNGAVPGLVLESPNTLSQKIKERMAESWARKFNPKSGGRRPVILDGGLQIKDISSSNFKELDFENSINLHEERILKAIGVPPLLLQGGNNANIRPNMRLYYLETVVPIVKKINKAYQRYFGFEIFEDLTGVEGLQPELRDKAQYYTGLVNGGIITPNEARRPLGLPDLEDGGDTIRIPANIAGSAANPDEGGRPDEDSEE